MKKIIFFLFLSQLAFGQRYKPKAVVGLLGAFGAEVALVKESLQKPKTVMVDGVTFTCGRLGKQRVVLAETGIGKVNAAMTTALMLDHFRPRQVLFTGIAGGTNADLQPGDIVIARQTAHHDYQTISMNKQPIKQTYSLSGKLNPAFFPADSLMLQQAQTVVRSIEFESIPVTKRPPTVITGIVVTGDQFISSSEKVAQLRQMFNADATEMEGAAVAQVCHELQVPHLVIRSLSDRADDNARSDMLTFYQIAARNSAKVVIALVKAL